jgi:hypothetical protein
MTDMIRPQEVGFYPFLNVVSVSQSEAAGVEVRGCLKVPGYNRLSVSIKQKMEI